MLNKKATTYQYLQSASKAVYTILIKIHTNIIHLGGGRRLLGYLQSSLLGITSRHAVFKHKFLQLHNNSIKINEEGYIWSVSLCKTVHSTSQIKTAKHDPKC